MLPQVSNTMGQAWLTLTQARAVLTQARNALVEATFVADVTWSRWARRGAWRRKWMWVVGLGGTMGLEDPDPRSVASIFSSAARLVLTPSSAARFVKYNEQEGSPVRPPFVVMPRVLKFALSSPYPTVQHHHPPTSGTST